MITINIRHTFPDVAKRINELPDEIANKAVVRALNATVRKGQSVMARQISKEFMVTQAQARRTLELRYARASKGVLKLEAALLSENRSNRAQGRALNLIRFVEQQVSLAEAKRRRKGGTLNQLRFKIKRSGGPQTMTGAFIAHNKKTGGTAVFTRESAKRYPIKARTTIGFGQMFNTRRVSDVVRQVMLDGFRANFARELRGVLKGF